MAETTVHLQVALDFLELPRALKVAEAAFAGGADYIEAGTPLIKSEGLDAVRRLREMFPEAVIIADTKTMDAGRIETEAAAKAGANVMTVCAAAAPGTIRECVEAARHYGLKVAVDLLGVADPVAAAKDAEKIGVDWVDVHCPIDAQMAGKDPLDDLKRIRAAVTCTVAVAGGLNSETAPAAAAAGADVIIVGGAITKAVDPKQSAGEIRRAMDTGAAVSTSLFKRTGASAEDIRELLESQQIRTSNISDGSHRRPCLVGLRPLIAGKFICGPAVTVRTMPGDWSKPVQAIDVASAGYVIVVDAGGIPPAIWGELATESAVNKHLSGLVVEGAVRDSAEIRRLDFPIWSRHVVSHAGDPKGLGTINEPITICGQTICPGDWIVADDDGVMVLPAAQAAEMVNRGADILEAENRIRQEIRDQVSTLAKVLNLARWDAKGRGGPAVG